MVFHLRWFAAVECKESIQWERTKRANTSSTSRQEIANGSGYLVDGNDDEQQVVFGQLDSEPLVANDLKLEQRLAISYQKVREHKKPPDFLAH
jgi:hypothetical protein